MSRTLGSFNQRVNLPRHREDYAPVKPEENATKTLSTGGYTLGIAHNQAPYERPGRTGGEKFVKGTVRRMAGQAVNMDVTRSTGLASAFSAQPIIGSAQLRTPNIPQ